MMLMVCCLTSRLRNTDAGIPRDGKTFLGWYYTEALGQRLRQGPRPSPLMESGDSRQRAIGCAMIDIERERFELDTGSKAECICVV